MRFVGISGEVHVSFILGKCKVVPRRPVLTIPRLELMACVLATRLAVCVRKELSWSISEFFWSDSNVALGYIRNETARFKVFVANRVQTIRDRTRVEDWHHINSEDNPADDDSRSKQTVRWLNGPELLYKEILPSLEPTSNIDILPDVCMDIQAHEVSDVATYRNWFATKKVFAWVLRFLNNCKPHLNKLKGNLSLEEMSNSETCLLRLTQVHHFDKELDAISKGNTLPHSSKLSKLDCFLDEKQILRAGGRLRNSSLPFEVRHPVILPALSNISVMIVDHCHGITKHQGRGMLVNELRSSGYWIVGLTRFVKRVIQRCVICQRLRGQPVEQKMSDLPPDRLSSEPAFTNVGCDCFGPFIVKNGRSCAKRHGLIFTCLASRAIHIEMCYSLSTDSFLNAFRRFVSIRGPVRVLRCDQGTNFVGARNDLLKMNCELMLNPPNSSHRGGVWERMIGVARRVLEGILVEHGQQLDDESLLTMLAETANIVNSRPLCSLSSHDLEPLTANQLLTMKSKVVVPPLLYSMVSADLYAIRRWKRVQYLANLFWSRWRKEFLPLYLQRPKWVKARKNLSVDDIVLVVDEQVHRSHWKMARVVDVKASRDNLVRSVSVVLADGTVLDRAVQKLVFLMHG